PMVGDIPFRAWQPSCYGGRLPSLEAELFSHSLGEAWTDQPEGVPDVERLLMQRPAFRTSRRVMTRGRQLVVFGGYSTGIDYLVNWATRLLDRVAPDMEVVSSHKFLCAKLLLWAFCCCLYDTACRGGGTLGLQAIWSQEGPEFPPCHSSGLMPVTSLEQLARVLLEYPQGMSIGWPGRADQDSIQQAFHVPDALVLAGDRKQKLLKEFLDTMDIEAFLADMGQRLRALVCENDE
ncbi:MAG: hypothetical protein OXC07_08095, partial [Kistimonas sp.]|nr:hypothetical protein [Kistimonas sp.]